MATTVTSQIQGITISEAVKAPCRAVALTNITLSGLQTLSGVALAEGDRVLVPAQTTGSENGIYNASTGTWQRAKDFDGTRDVVQGTRVLVVSVGNQGTEYELTTANPITIGTTSLSFQQRYGANATYDQTGAEIAAGVTPINYGIPSHDSVGVFLVARYGIDGAAIETAIDVAEAAGGGVVVMSARTYAIDTLSSHADAHFSFITPRDGVSLIGQGMGKTILRVANGMNVTGPGTNSPNVIGTNQTLPLTDCMFSDFTVDWNGANNLLGALDTRRNNASIITTHGARRVYCERIEVKETPGNQCIFFSNSTYTTDPAGPVAIRDCVFKDNGDGLPGNVNPDHSSIYCLVDDATVENCVFDADEPVFGSCYELHGSNNVGRNNRSRNYERGFWLASDYAAIKGQHVYGDYHRNLQRECFSGSAPTYTIYDARVEGCTFELDTTKTFSTITYFCLSSAAFFDSLTMEGNEMIGNNQANHRALSVNKIRNFFFRRNKVRNFIDATHGYGIASGNGDIGSSLIAERVVIEDNDFYDVYAPVNIQPATLGVHELFIKNNRARISVASIANPVRINMNAGRGQVSGNDFDDNYPALKVNITGGCEISPTSFTGTLTGCDTSPTGSVRYDVDGNIVHMSIPVINGTSNTTACTLTGMPVHLRPQVQQTVSAFGVDNGATEAQRWLIATSGTITLQKGFSSTGFTASGSKGTAQCTITYRVN